MEKIHFKFTRSYFFILEVDVLTFDVSVNHVASVYGVDSFEDVPGVVSDHLLCQPLLSDHPQRPLITILHEHVQFVLKQTHYTGQ